MFKWHLIVSVIVWVAAREAEAQGFSYSSVPDIGYSLYDNQQYDSSSVGGKLIRPQQNDRVNIQCYYETMCPACRNFFVKILAPVLRKLGSYINIQTYPYGNTKTLQKYDGAIEFQCQHGPAESYGNKLHACALDMLSNATQAVLYNTCMMDYWQQGKGSDDAAADNCGMTMSVNADPIKTCAKGYRGTQLLNYYGELSKQAHFKYVPYHLVNGEEIDEENLFRDVCATFRNPPPECY